MAHQKPIPILALMPKGHEFFNVNGFGRFQRFQNSFSVLMTFSQILGSCSIAFPSPSDVSCQITLSKEQTKLQKSWRYAGLHRWMAGRWSQNFMGWPLCLQYLQNKNFLGTLVAEPFFPKRATILFIKLNGAFGGGFCRILSVESPKIGCRIRVHLRSKGFWRSGYGYGAAYRASSQNFSTSASEIVGVSGV